jgi:hypothetical protein
MKYLRRFNENLNSIGQDLSDIFLEVNDETFWKVESWYVVSQEKWIVIIQTVDEDEEYELEGQTPLPIVIESIERAIDFMSGSGFTNHQIMFENTDDVFNQSSSINLEEVSNLDVWPNNFIRIEFTK